MSDTQLILLLQLVKANAGAEPLLKRGLRYSQIAKLLSIAFDNDYVKEVDNKLVITKKGANKLKEDSRKWKLRKDGGWISYEDESRVESIPINRPHLPDINNSYFKK